MFEFYRLITDDENKTLEIKKFQYEETPELLKLQEELIKEKNKYEKYEVTYWDRYNHVSTQETTYPLSLSNSIFNDDNKIIGYLIGGKVFFLDEKPLTVYEEIRGVTGITSTAKIRKK